MWLMPAEPSFAASSSIQREERAFPKILQSTSKRKETMQNNSSFTDEQDEQLAASEENGREQQAEELRLPPETPLPAGVSLPTPSRRSAGRKQLTLIAVVSALLLPVLLAQPVQLAPTSRSMTGATIVGHVFFTSSGQLDPTSSEGLND